MSLKDTKNGYSGLSIALHWITAIIIIALCALGEIAGQNDGQEALDLIRLHISIAMSVYVILIARVIWRATNVRPALPQQSRTLTFLSKWVPIILILAICLMLISGPLTVWAKGNAIGVFGLVSIASPLGKMEALHQLMQTVHNVAAAIIYICFLLHVVGVIKHLMIDRDDTLVRMIKPGNTNQEHP